MMIMMTMMMMMMMVMVIMKKVMSTRIAIIMISKLAGW